MEGAMQLRDGAHSFNKEQPPGLEEVVNGVFNHWFFS